MNGGMIENQQNLNENWLFLLLNDVETTKPQRKQQQHHLFSVEKSVFSVEKCVSTLLRVAKLGGNTQQSMVMKRIEGTPAIIIFKLASIFRRIRLSFKISVSLGTNIVLTSRIVRY